MKRSLISTKWLMAFSVIVIAAFAGSCSGTITLVPTSSIQTSITTSTSVTSSVATTAQNIVDIAVADGRFTTLVKALQAADLVTTLQGPGPFTVFAPTDDAFNQLPAGTLDNLLKDIPTLKDILLYHVVSGKVMAADVVKLTTATTVEGKPVTVSVVNGKVMINDAEVIITDILASNGVIHVINKVLMPPTASTKATT